MRIAFIAGELSGDQLGGAIIEALKALNPAVETLGLTGPRMAAAGCRSIGSIEQLSLMGIAEILPAVPRLLRLRRQLVAQLLGERPDVVVSIDAPDFNLGLQQRLRARGLRTLHVVSPTIWAWRAGRVHAIRRAVSDMLCLFPFEPQHYAGSGVQARFIGHPLADEIAQPLDRAACRRMLGVDAAPTLAVLPGSRGGEVRCLAPVFAQTVAQLCAHIPGLKVLTPVAKPALAAFIDTARQAHAPEADWTLIPGEARTVMGAADAVLLASGTATLEALLVGRPMVVGYRGAALTAWLMLKAGLLKSRFVSLPNLLTDHATVPERLQQDCTADVLCADLLPLLQSTGARDAQLHRFDAVRAQLAIGAGAQAARVIQEVARRG